MDIESLALMVDAYSTTHKINIRESYHECCVFLKREDQESFDEFKQVKQYLFDLPRKLEGQK